VVPNQPDIRYSEQSINNILMLKGFVQYIPSLFEALTGANSSKIAATVEYIRGVINEDVTYQKAPLDLRNQRTYAVKVIASFLSFDTRILIIV
jgi:DNA mismatch repair protein MSH4